MSIDTRSRPFEDEIVDETCGALLDLKYSKPYINLLCPSQFPGFPRWIRSRQITLQGIRESKAEEEQQKGFGETSRSTAVPKNGGKKNKRKGDNNSHANENSSAKRGPSDADLRPTEPKFNKIEFRNGKLIFRKVDQCSTSASSSSDNGKRTPFKPKLDSNVRD